MRIAATALRMGSFDPEKFSPVQYLQKREQHMKTSTITAPATIRTQAFVTVKAESEEEALKLPDELKTLPDYLPKESKLVIVGINPSLVAAQTGRYYSGRGNQFWPLINDSGLVAERLECSDAERVTEFGIGLTDLVKRPTKGSDGVSTREFVEGRDALHRKLEGIDRARVIAFNGKIVYEKFMGRKCEYGVQEERLYGAMVYVLPSTSRRCGRISYRQKLRHFRNISQLLKTEEDGHK
jgi:mismatch-specific thymine-DNA glycosylase